MKQAYYIKGISCSGCIANVTKALTSIPGITVEKVQKESPQAIVYSPDSVSKEMVEAALLKTGKYFIESIQNR